MTEDEKLHLKGLVRLYGQAASYAERYTETYYFSHDPIDKEMADRWANRAERLISDIEGRIDKL